MAQHDTGLFARALLKPSHLVPWHDASHGILGARMVDVLLRLQSMLHLPNPSQLAGVCQNRPLFPLCHCHCREAMQEGNCDLEARREPGTPTCGFSAPFFVFCVFCFFGGRLKGQPKQRGDTHVTEACFGEPLGKRDTSGENEKLKSRP